jgi:hypothetical protein
MGGTVGFRWRAAVRLRCRIGLADRAFGGHRGWDGEVVIALWIHDEIVTFCKPEIADQVGEILTRNAVEPATFYGSKAPLAADYVVARSWAGELTMEVPAAEAELVNHLSCPHCPRCPLVLARLNGAIIFFGTAIELLMLYQLLKQKLATR